jgi:hypothetical protein
MLFLRQDSFLRQYPGGSHFHRLLDRDEDHGG